ncbi:MAG TPA: hypothetical protein VMU42_18445 [Candidatus Sulfotelmatobacter sp.]|nr:hypothetical protein [Candidatus Sulfotelmatobacter sp.]
MYRWFLLAAVIIFAASPAASADDASSSVEVLRREGYNVRSITPIFSQLLMLSVPKGFHGAFEVTRGRDYLQESVPKGETVDEWTQMITLTGSKDLAANPKLNPQIVAEAIAGGFKRACPSTFSGMGISTFKVSGHDAFAGVAACGTVIFRGSKQSQAALIIAIKGDADYYTVQWAERTAAVGKPVELVRDKWLDRIKALGPIKLCPIVPGEAAPYPSCINHQ